MSMFDLNINKGFESMIPKDPEEEATIEEKNTERRFSITILKYTLAISFTVNRS